MLKQRIALWALGLALPEMSVLKPVMQRSLRSIAYVVFAGIMAAVMVTGGLCLLYLHLIKAGLPTGTALWLIFGIGALLMLVAWLLAMRQLRKMSDVSDSLRLFDHPAQEMLGEAVQLIAAGFIEGLLQKPSHPSDKS